MPVLPYQQRVNVGGGSQQPYATAVAPSDAIARGLGAVAKGLNDVEDGQRIGRERDEAAYEKETQKEERAQAERRRLQAILDQQQKEDARVWGGFAVSDLQVKMHGLFSEMQGQAKDGASGFVPDFLSKFDDTTKATIALAPDEASKQYLSEHVASMRSQFGAQAVAFEAGATRGWRTDQHQRSVDNWATVVARDPSQYGQAVANIEATMPDVGPAQREKLTDYAKKTLTQAAAGRAVMADPGGSFAAFSKALNIPTPQAADPQRVLTAVDNLPTPVMKVVAAIYGQESGSGAADTSQPNYAGARGPMQVTLETFNGMKAKGMIPKDADWANPNDTMAAGVTLVKALAAKYGNDPRKIAAAYYAGEKAVNADGTINNFRDLKNPKAPDTLGYVEQVMGRLGKSAAPAAPDLQPAPAGDVTKTGIPWVDAMTPAELLHYRQQAYTEMNRVGSVQRTGLERWEQDANAMALAGKVPPNVPSRESYVAAFGPIEGALRYRTNVEEVVTTGQAIARLQTASPAEREQIIAAAKPVEGEGFAAGARHQQALVQAAQIIEKQLKDDPASYVGRNSPRVKAAFDALRAAPPENNRAQLDAFAAESIAEQKRLGVLYPQLLTDDQAAKIAQQFSEQKEGGVNAAKLIDGLEQQWGAHFPTVYRQLQKDQKLPPAALVIPNMKDYGSKERLARLSMVDDKVLRERLQPGEQKDVEAALLSKMEPFWNTLSYQGGGERTYSTVRAQAEKLALSYVASGKSVKDAATQAFEEVAGWKYQFESSYRIPRSEIPEQVTRGVQALQYRLHELPTMPPPAPAGMRQTDVAAQWTDALKKNAVFVTNGDESGVVLYVRGSGGLAPVRSPGGQQIGFTWSQLRQEAAATPSPFVGYAKP